MRWIIYEILINIKLDVDFFVMVDLITMFGFIVLWILMQWTFIGIDLFIDVDF